MKIRWIIVTTGIVMRLLKLPFVNYLLFLKTGTEGENGKK